MGALLAKTWYSNDSLGCSNIKFYCGGTGKIMKKKQVSFLFALLICSSSISHAFSMRSALTAIAYPFTATYRGIKKAGPRMVRFCKSNPEDALMLGIIGAALIVGLMNKYRGDDDGAPPNGPAPRFRFSNLNYDSDIPNAVKPKSEFPQRNQPAPFQNARYKRLEAENKARCQSALRKLRDNGQLNDEKIAKHHCAICDSPDYVLLKCTDKICRDCWTKWKKTEPITHTIEHAFGECPNNDQNDNRICWKQAHACPVCRMPNAEITEY